MMEVTSRVNSWRILALLSIISCIFLILTYTEHVPALPQSIRILSLQQPLTITEVIRRLYAPLVLPIDAAEFISPEGTTYFSDGEVYFRDPLGKRVCILDVDTRALDGPGMVMNVSRVDWSRINRLSAGMLNHYMYAEIHGYDYKFIRGVNYNDRHGTWVKPAAIAQVLPEYDFVVFLDADAIFPHLEIPIEWLLNYWRISPQISAALALDPPLKVNDDVHGHTMLNTGFVIFQNNEKTREIVKDWEECPTDTKYPTCSNWTYKWAHEQSAFSNFIRYDHPENVMELPCAEANGAPQAKHMGGCTGTFVQHFWVNKDLVPSMVAKSIMNVLMDRLHGQYLDNVKEIYVEGSNATYSIAASKELD